MEYNPYMQRRNSSFGVKFLGFIVFLLSAGFILSIFPYFQKYLWILGSVNSSTDKLIHIVLGAGLLMLSFLLMKNHHSLY